MKYVKIIGLLAVAATAMMAFAATASAGVATSPSGTVYTKTIVANNELGHVNLHNETADIECASNVSTENINQHGPGVTVRANVSALAFSGCTGGWTVTVNAAGSLEVHTQNNGHGTLTSSNATVTAVSSTFGITCRYLTNNTDIGTITPAPINTGHATLDINASIPFHSGSIFCGGESSQWTGFYKVTTPTGLRFS